jgi:hypothetical protein
MFDPEMKKRKEKVIFNILLIIIGIGNLDRF